MSYPAELHGDDHGRHPDSRRLRLSLTNSRSCYHAAWVSGLDGCGGSTGYRHVSIAILQRTDSLTSDSKEQGLDLSVSVGNHGDSLPRQRVLRRSAFVPTARHLIVIALRANKSATARATPTTVRSTVPRVVHNSRPGSEQQAEASEAEVEQVPGD